MKIDSQNVLVTGANRGIGRGLAKMFAMEKAHVHLAVRTEDQSFTEELSRLGARSVTTWKADLGSRNGVDKLLQELGEQRIDILVNNAGQLTGGLLEEQPLDEIYSMLQVNVSSLIQLTRGIIPGMIRNRHGKIINNSSVSAIMHFPCASTYAASKAAVYAFTNCLHAELHGTGVTTLCLITPGVKTRMFDEIEVKYGKNLEVPTDSISPEQYAQMVREAIETDLPILEPKGATGVGLKIARHLPGVFSRGAIKRFRR